MHSVASTELMCRDTKQPGCPHSHQTDLNQIDAERTGKGDLTADEVGVTLLPLLAADAHDQLLCTRVSKSHKNESVGMHRQKVFTAGTALHAHCCKQPSLVIMITANAPTLRIASLHAVKPSTAQRAAQQCTQRFQQLPAQCIIVCMISGSERIWRALQTRSARAVHSVYAVVAQPLPAAAYRLPT